VERRIGRRGRKVQNLIAIQVVEGLAHRRHREMRFTGGYGKTVSLAQVGELVRAIALG
jgi:hypothetical protein